MSALWTRDAKYKIGLARMTQDMSQAHCRRSVLRNPSHDLSTMVRAYSEGLLAAGVALAPTTAIGKFFVSVPLRERVACLKKDKEEAFRTKTGRLLTSQFDIGCDVRAYLVCCTYRALRMFAPDCTLESLCR